MGPAIAYGINWSASEEERREHSLPNYLRAAEKARYGHKGAFVSDFCFGIRGYEQLVPVATTPAAELRELYDSADDTAVQSYLAQHTFLAAALYEAHAKIREYFGPEDRLSLNVVEEPDAKGSRRLFVLIHTALRPRDALAVLDELDRTWWLEALSATEGRLSIDLEYG